MGADVRRGERVIDDGDLVTSGGITSGLHLGLHLVERLVSADARLSQVSDGVPLGDPAAGGGTTGSSSELANSVDHCRLAREGAALIAAGRVLLFVLSAYSNP
jgi:transcriptional regulator GlxA family with amidase domain